MPAHSYRMQNAGLVQSRDDPGKDTRAFRKGSMGQPVGTGQAETSTWVVNAEGITVQCCQQLQAALASLMYQAGCQEHGPWLLRSGGAEMSGAPNGTHHPPGPAQGLLVRGQLRTLAQQGWQQEEFPMG